MTSDIQANRRNVAEWLEVSQGTLRSWERQFRQWLESPVGKKGDATRKIYTENDLLVLQSIKQLRNNGWRHRQIEKRLADEIANSVLVWPQPIGTQPDPLPESSSNALSVSVREQQLVRELNKIQVDMASMGGKLSSIRQERDRLLQELEKEREARVRAERDAAAADAKLDMLKGDDNKPDTLWDRWFNRKR